MPAIFRSAEPSVIGRLRGNRARHVGGKRTHVAENQAFSNVLTGERWSENEGLGTVRKLDRVNRLFLMGWNGGEGGIRIYLLSEISRNPADSDRTEAIDSMESLDGRTKRVRGESRWSGLSEGAQPLADVLTTATSGHDSSNRPSSSWLIVRPASTSASPRSTVRRTPAVNELFERAVVGLLIEHTAELILRRGRSAHGPILGAVGEPRAGRRACGRQVLRVVS